MKKFICTILVPLMLLPLAACGTTPPSTVESATSSSAEQVLIDRLGEVPDNVVLGDSAVAAEYGIDMSSFENDGYIIRTVGNDTLILGKTSDALESAARKYAKATVRNEDVPNVTYHEGYRIEKFEIFGVDISEYVIVYGNEPNEGMTFAASELRQLVKKACGAELTVSEAATDAPHKIILRRSSDEALGNQGYRYFAEEGNLVIEGAGVRGCVNGVYRFLQNECGWDQLAGGDSVLQEAEIVSIPSDIDRSEVPAFDYLSIHGTFWDGGFRTDRVPKSFSAITKTGHGIYRFLENNDSMAKQPCYTDEDTYEMVYEGVESYIKGLLSAGRVIGVDFLEIDLGQNDSSDYCLCRECAKVFKQEGNVNCGPVVRFINKLSEELNETYPGLVYKIFAYGGSNKPCKTDPNEHVYITYCFDGVCSNHPLDAKSCNGGINGYGRKSEDYAKWFEDWTKKTNNIYVWFYALDTNFHDYTNVDTIYYDFRYLKEHNVKGIFYQSTYHGLGTKRIEHQLVYELNYNIDMTKEEYYALYCSLMKKEYGPGWENVLEYMSCVNKAQDLKQCWHCWGYAWPNLRTDVYYDTSYFGENYDYFVELMDGAISMAETSTEIKRCEMLMIGALYKGCYSLYFTAYENDDTELMAKLSERFDRAMALMKKYGFKMENGIGEYPTIDTLVCFFKYESIHDAAWLDWHIDRDVLFPGHQKPIPDIYEGTCQGCGQTTVDRLPDGVRVKCTECFWETAPGHGIDLKIPL